MRASVRVTVPPVSAPAPSEPDALLARIAADQWGVVTLGDARRCGLSRKAVMVRVRKGLIHPLHRGVFALGHPAIPLEGEMLAAVKACGDGAALSHFACCAHWDFVNWDGREIEVIVSGSGTRVHAGIRVHRSELLPRSHLMTHRGIFCTSPARALIDMAADAPQEQVRGAIRRAMSLRRVSAQGLASALTRLGPRRGSAKVAKVLTAGYVPTRSELEDVVYELICKGGFVPPDVNVPLRIGRRTVIPDFRWPERRLIVEADGAKWHDNEVAREDDAERQALLEVSGERVLRVTWHQAIGEPAQTRARFAAAGAPVISGRLST